MDKKFTKNHVYQESIDSFTPDKGTYVQRIHKDKLFRFIFRDKRKLLQLYNAINNYGCKSLPYREYPV